MKQRVRGRSHLLAACTSSELLAAQPRALLTGISVGHSPTIFLGCSTAAGLPLSLASAVQPTFPTTISLGGTKQEHLCVGGEREAFHLSPGTGQGEDMVGASRMSSQFRGSGMKSEHRAAQGLVYPEHPGCLLGRETTRVTNHF